MCNLNVKFFPALNGDSFLISFNAKNILIDGGYVSTYRNYIKPNLLELRKNNEKIDYLVVTHIDGDHISGIIKFLEENNNAPIIDIENIWHNSYRHLQNLELNDQKFSSPALKKIEEMNISPILKDDTIESEKNVSAKKGSTLACLIREGLYNWNSQFSNGAVCIDTIKIVDDDIFNFKMLSPNKVKLDKLKKYWAKELYKLGYINDQKTAEFIDDAFEFIISKEKELKIIKDKNVSSSKINFEELSLNDFPEDTTAANGSSISFVLEVGGKKMLFLADSHPSVIIESLKLHYDIKEFPLYFDLIKISHHGSILNTSKELLNLIDSDKYIISTNGNSFDHPDIETIARIVSRKTNLPRNLYFNYHINIIDLINVKVLKDKYNYECIIAAENIPFN